MIKEVAKNVVGKAAVLSKKNVAETAAGVGIALATTAGIMCVFDEIKSYFQKKKETRESDMLSEETSPFLYRIPGTGESRRYDLNFSDFFEDDDETLDPVDDISEDVQSNINENLADIEASVNKLENVIDDMVDDILFLAEKRKQLEYEVHRFEEKINEKDSDNESEYKPKKTVRTNKEDDE